MSLQSDKGLGAQRREAGEVELALVRGQRRRGPRAAARSAESSTKSIRKTRETWEIGGTITPVRVQDSSTPPPPAGPAAVLSTANLACPTTWRART
jgi:hypothetical protein